MKKFSVQQLVALKLIYKKKGYVVLKHFFDEELVKELNLWVNDIIQWPNVSNQWLRYFEQLENREKILSRIENFVAYHEGFKNLTQNKALLSLLSLLLGEPALFFKEKLNIKAPGANGYTPHQDAPAFFDIEYDAISLFIPVDAATIHNGCLYFLDENEPYQPKMLPQNDDNRALNQDLAKKLQWKPIECHPGDLIIFSSYAPHYSLKNESNLSRKAVFLTFGKHEQTIGKTKQYYENKRKIFPQDAEKDASVDYTEAAKIYSYSSPVIVNV